MTMPRGLFYCSFNDSCDFAPEIWRKHDNKTKIGYCLKHAVQLGICDPPQPDLKKEIKKSLLDELLEQIAAGKIEELLPPTREIRSKFSIDGQPSDLPF